MLKTSPQPVRYSGAVLAGGRSSRFGQDKSRFVYNGAPLLSRVLASLEGAGERFVISRQTYPNLDVPVYPDLTPNLGPLGGLQTALRASKEDWLALAACDLPNLSPHYWQALAARAEGAAVVVTTERGPQPLAALYHRGISNEVDALLAEGERSMKALLTRLEPQKLTLAELGLPSNTLLNVNRLSDLPLS